MGRRRHLGGGAGGEGAQHLLPHVRRQARQQRAQLRVSPRVRRVCTTTTALTARRGWGGAVQAVCGRPGRPESPT